MTQKPRRSYQRHGQSVASAVSNRVSQPGGADRCSGRARCPAHGPAAGWWGATDQFPVRRDSGTGRAAFFLCAGVHHHRGAYGSPRVTDPTAERGSPRPPQGPGEGREESAAGIGLHRSGRPRQADCDLCAWPRLPDGRGHRGRSTSVSARRFPPTVTFDQVAGRRPWIHGWPMQRYSSTGMGWRPSRCGWCRARSADRWCEVFQRITVAGGGYAGDAG